MIEHQISYSLHTIGTAVEEFWVLAHPYPVVAFYGEMGSGKTTFISALCRLIGVNDEVSSPTFALINDYVITTPPQKMLAWAGHHSIIRHMDWYRINALEEALRAGLEDALHGALWALVEWSDKAEAILPVNTLHVYFEINSAVDRTLLMKTFSV